MVINISKKFLFLIFIFTFSFISAEFSVGNVSHSIITSYGVGENLSGWINISFDGESGNSTLKSSDGGQIPLIDLLKKTSNSGFDYNCTPANCEADYISTNEGTSKTFNLGAGESAIFGFKITGNNKLSDITSFKFNLVTNNPETNVFPLSIDVLNDGVNEWEAYSASSNYESENPGCYIGLEGEILKARIATSYYCGKVELERTPEVEIGAYVNYLEGSTNVQFDMRIEAVEGGNSKTCTATATGSGRISCVPSDFQVKKAGAYYVCIKAKNSADANNYEINYESTNPCGFSGNYDGSYDYDFEVFERSKTFASNINFVFDNSELSKANSLVSNLENHIENYIAETYQNNCNNGCIVPIKINSGLTQQITVSNARIIYVAGISQETNSFFDISMQPTSISSGFQRLYLTDAGFNVSNKKEDYPILVYLDDELLFEEEISVGEVPIIDYVTPLKTAIKYPTKFLTKVISDFNITSYKWSFGDGDTETSAINQITHTYSTIGTYSFILTVTNSMGSSASKTFNVIVRPASEIVPTLIDLASVNILSLEEDLKSFTGFKKTSLEKTFDVGDIKDKILTLKDSESKASSEADYEEILKELLEMKIPLSVGESSSGQGIIFYPEKENINLDVLKEISGGNYISGKDEEYKDAILAWGVSNVDVNLEFNEISAIYEDYQETAVRIFQMSITKNSEEPIYLIIQDMEDLLFAEDYSITEYDGYKYLQIDGSTQKIVFSTTEDVDFLTLPIFISPSLNEITLPEWSAFDDSGNLKRWITFTIIAVGVLLVTFIVYIILQIWYKRKYETYLFKDRNNLYNLVNYVKASREKGIKDRDIETNLKKAGWTAEQLRYVMRKFEGKNTGMPEIPIKKILKEKENKTK
jgi:PKD repeat protein